MRNNLNDNDRRAFLSDAQRAGLLEALKRPPPDGLPSASRFDIRAHVR